MAPIISVQNLSKTYKGGFEALKNVNLEVEKGEIFALLGPNGAGKTTLIATICGLVNPTSGRVLVNGHDIVENFREARSEIGLVPQEIALDIFSTPWATIRFSRGLFGKARNDAYLDKVLDELSLADKKHTKNLMLSGGMKRRVTIAKALCHEPTILFLDEPTAGVDVELRKEMWELVREMRASGVTIILTTHYIEEAEMMADRIGVINHGELVLVEDKKELIRKMGRKELKLELQKPLKKLPSGLGAYDLEIGEGGSSLKYTYDAQAGRTGITALLADLGKAGVTFSDLATHQSSLEEIFVGLIGADK